MLDKFQELYNEDRPAFDSVEGLLKSVGLYNSTQYPVEELLLKAGLSRLLIDELITVRRQHQCLPYSGTLVFHGVSFS